tara:strand:- start:3697 stop:4068 length:372 start_codon:yes stop_codon:yes gene_type:complete
MTKEEFREYCNENNLRYKKDACGDPISPSRRGLKTDQLYWTGTKEIGIYAERATQKKFTFLKNKILATGAQINQDGDTDSTFFATQEQALEIARLLGCAKNSVSKETRDKMSRLFKERMNYND